MTAAILVVADDFTGGNAAAAGFARAGLRAVTVSTQRAEVTSGELAARFDVIVATTDSRHCSAVEAASRMETAISATWPVSLVSNRIDTTLRGHIGVSTRAALRLVGLLGGRPATALCVPAHPAAGRQTVHGVQLLGGVRLEDTELAKDPLNPVLSSDVMTIATRDTELTASLVPLEVVTGDHDGLVAALAAAASTDVVVVDALTEDHLERIARAAAVLADRVSWVSVDPGPFAVRLADALGLVRAASATAAPILAVSGSASVLTRIQLRRLVAERSTLTVVCRVDGDRLDVEGALVELRTKSASAGPEDVVLLTSALDDSHIGELSHEASVRLSEDLAVVAHSVMTEFAFGGIYCTGGDVTAAVLSRLGAQGLEVEGEVLPLAVAGSLVGGPWDGLPIVTKGGLIGGTDAAVSCIQHLEAVRALRRSPRADASMLVSNYLSRNKTEEHHV